LRSQTGELGACKLECKIVGETVAITLDLLIEPFRRNPIESRQVRIQDDFLPPDEEDGSLDSFSGYEVRRKGLAARLRFSSLEHDQLRMIGDMEEIAVGRQQRQSMLHAGRRNQAVNRSGLDPLGPATLS
jgi:hypothetical protein